MTTKCPNCGKEINISRLQYDPTNLDKFYTNCTECSVRFNIDFNPTNTFISDVAKMADFKILTMEEFLSTYGYIAKNEYEATKLYLSWLNTDNSEL